MSILTSFWKSEACGQTVLPDRSVLIGQKMVENAKIKKFKWDILGDYQTMFCYTLIAALNGNSKENAIYLKNCILDKLHFNVKTSVVT